MPPHSNQHIFTKEGYIIAIEEILNLSENLPKRFYKLDIESAVEIYRHTIASGKIGFLEACKKIEISTEGIFE